MGIEVLVMGREGGREAREGGASWHQAQPRSPFLAHDLGLDEFGCC